MNTNLGNLDGEAVYANVCNFFQSEPKRRFGGNGIGAKTDFLSFIKTSRHLFQVIRKAEEFSAK
jgi:hypothetical protein